MTWVQVQIDNQVMLGFAYEDPQAGPSAKGAIVQPESLEDDVRRAVERPDHTVRLGLRNFPSTPLPAATIARLGLPAEPPWMEFFRPRSAQPWLRDPALADRFHRDYPNDLEVLFMFPGHRMERMWVRTTGVDPEIGGYGGELLNQPFTEDADLAQGAQVAYRLAPGVPEPIWVSPVMRANLGGWSSRCTVCGFDMLTEPAQAIAARQFGEWGGQAVTFTTRCPMCEHAMMVERRQEG
jgi:hypothetical protein